MASRLKGKRALVTGGSRGIGRVIALDLAKNGAKVAVVSRTKRDLMRVVEEMGGASKGHRFVACDLTQKNAAAKVVAALKRNFGPVDILINNVGGTLKVWDPFSKAADWRRVFRINFEVALELNNLIIPRMKQKKSGRIIHMSSFAAIQNTASVPYSVAKAALLTYSRGLKELLAPFGIVVASVLPGKVRPASEIKDKKAKRKFCTPEEVSRLVLSLCTAPAAKTPVAVVLLDGNRKWAA